MIKVVVDDNNIKISGHANYDAYGKDIVCSSVSSIVITSVNAILSLAHNSIDFEDDQNTMIIKKLDNNEISDKLLNNMLNMLASLESDYPKNIKIIRNEGK